MKSALSQGSPWLQLVYARVQQINEEPLRKHIMAELFSQLTPPPNHPSKRQLLDRQDSGETGGEDGFQMRHFDPDTLDEHLVLLNRVHLQIPHIPEAHLTGNFHSVLQLSVRLYYNDLAQIMKDLPHSGRLSTVIQLTQTYMELTKEYGLFEITPQHVRTSGEGGFVLWVNQNYFLSHPDRPITHTSKEAYLVERYIGMVGQFFKPALLSNKSFATLEDVKKYLSVIQNRNKMHRKCSQNARENIKNCKSVIQERTTPLLTSSSFTSLKGGDLSKSLWGSQKSGGKSLLTTLFGSKMVSSQIRGRKSSLGKRSTARRCSSGKRDLEFSRLFDSGVKTSILFGSLSTPSIIPPENKHPLIFSDQPRVKSSLNSSFCPVKYKKKDQSRSSMIERTRTNSPGRKDFQSPFKGQTLTPIHQDPDGEFRTSDARARGPFKIFDDE